MNERPQLSVVSLFTESLRRLFADEAVPLAGNIAFRVVFSLFPFLIFLTTLAGFFGTLDQAKTAINFLLDVAPEALVRPLEGEIIDILTVPRTGLLSLAALLTIWSAMAGVDSVRVGLNRAYDLRDQRSMLWLYFIDVVFIIGAAVFLLGFSFLLIALPLALRFAAAHGIELAGSLAALEQSRLLLSVILLLFSVTMAHVILPARRQPLRLILPGVLLTVLIWALMGFGFSWWLLRFDNLASTYASLSGLFAAMFFVYLAALALIFGGEVNRVLALLSNHQPMQSDKN